MAVRVPSDVVKLRTTVRWCMFGSHDTRYRVITETLLEKLKVKSVHVVLFVFFLVLAVTRFADPNTSLSLFVTACPPHVDGVINGE